jgi:hypothetical protein
MGDQLLGRSRTGVGKSADLDVVEAGQDADMTVGDHPAPTIPT